MTRVVKDRSEDQNYGRVIVDPTKLSRGIGTIRDSISPICTVVHF